MLGDEFQLHVAFSRETSNKVYVQQRLKENAAEVYAALLEQGGSLYICGDSRMARDVHNALCNLICDQAQVPKSNAEALLKNMKSIGRFQVRTLPCVALFYLKHGTQSVPEPYY